MKQAKQEPVYFAPSTGNVYCDRCECECNERCQNKKVSRVKMSERDELCYDLGIGLGETLTCSHCKCFLFLNIEG